MPTSHERLVTSKAVFLLLLLCGQECCAVRDKILLTTAFAVFSGGFQGADAMRKRARDQVSKDTNEQKAEALAAQLGPDALGKLERYLDAVTDEAEMWSKSRPMDEQPGEASMLELETHLDSKMKSGAWNKLSSPDMEEAMSEAQGSNEKVENLNVFLCKRSPINGYTDNGWVFQKRRLKDGYFSVSCTTRVNILNRGEVGKSLKRESEKEMVKGIDMLKSFTRGENDDKFPIKLKVCSRGGGCQQGSPQGAETAQLIESQEDIFGEPADINEQIPIPQDAKHNLPRQNHDKTHLYAVCYDQQDECDGMMWVPKNLEMCNGWFEDDDARATLGLVRDGIQNGGWGAYWRPNSANVRAAAKLTGNSGGLVSSDDAAEVQGIIMNSNTHHRDTCAVAKWQETEDAARQTDHEEVYDALSQSLKLYKNEKSAADALAEEIEGDGISRQAVDDTRSRLQQLKAGLEGLGDASPDIAQTMRSKIKETKAQLATERQQLATAKDTKSRRLLEEHKPILALAMERLKEATNICTEAAEAGEGTDCDGSDEQWACWNLKNECESIGVTLAAKDCMTKEQMLETMQSSTPVDESTEDDTSLVESGSDVASSRRHRYYDRRRRRRGSLIMDILFPSYYYHHHAYCYPWYGSHGAFYAYPIVPNVGGYTFGLGTFHPGLMLLEGMGHLAFHTARALIWAGGQLVQGAAWGIGNMFSWVGECGQDAAAFCIGAAVALAVLVAIGIGAIVYYSHCVNADENCRSWWYRGGRLRTKMRKWLGLWNRLEDHVYNDLGSYFFFDGLIESPDQCMKKLQWGRDWAKMHDDNWQAVAATNSSVDAFTDE